MLSTYKKLLLIIFYIHDIHCFRSFRIIHVPILYFIDFLLILMPSHFWDTVVLWYNNFITLNEHTKFEWKYGDILWEKFPYKKNCMKAFNFKSHSIFHGILQWNFTPFFGVRKLRISPKLEATEGSRLMSF
jgi:hypothetical protein